MGMFTSTYSGGTNNLNFESCAEMSSSIGIVIIHIMIRRLGSTRPLRK